ncbi:MAG TPA: AsmA-like C-terminal region-containing protein [Puia sp.]|nr:AsmA-like C-terminal region-containing protein [Puia sp.]
MKKGASRIIWKILKITGITAGSLLIFLFLLPYLFPRFVSNKIRQWARHSIQTELHFSAARLSFFRHFPALTLTLYNVRLNGSAPFEKQQLIRAEEISLGVDLRSVFSEVTIDKIYLTDAAINIQVDSTGRPNYNIYASKPAGKPVNEADSGSASLKIQNIVFEKCGLVYDDRSLGLLINARGLNYEGNGDLSKDIFDLHTHMQIDSMDLSYNKLAYFANKKINADLITKINTSSLAFIFERNELMINQLPVVVTGRFSFLKDGYDMDFQLKSLNSNLHDIFTALPPDMLNWLSKTEIKGAGDIEASLTGKYVAATNTMPDLNLNMKVRNGSIAYEKTPVPVSNLYLNFESRIPGLNPDSLHLTIDSVFFNIEKDYFSAILRMNGLKAPSIKAKIRSEIDLEKWDRAIGFAPLDLKGKYKLQLSADGQYATRVVRTTTLRKIKIDTVISSIPAFTLTSSLKNGYLKYASRPEAISNISFDLDASCADNDYRHTRLSMENLNANVLTSSIKGFFKLGSSNTAAAATSTNPTTHKTPSPASRSNPATGAASIDAALETVFHLADIKKVIPLDSIDLAGDLSVHIKTKGSYRSSKKQFPVTEADLQLSNGRVQTKYYPHPLENIQVSARITSRNGSMKDLGVALTPVSFLFEGQPFTMKMDLQDFSNLRYNITSRGTLDLGKIVKVFALTDYTITGLVDTRLSLRGLQSDATQGHYDRLYNEGSLKVKDLQVSSELFPLPFRIHTGLFRFDQDKMWFDAFDASYGKSRFTLNGWLSDVIGYMSDKKQPLKGKFDLTSDYVLVDQLMAFAGPSTGAKTPAAGTPQNTLSSAATLPSAPAAGTAHRTTTPTPAQTGAQPASAGVIIVPSDLAVSFHANIKKIQYNGLDIDSFKGGVSIDSGSVTLDTTAFTLVGAPVQMNASYKSLSPQRAEFDYHIQAKDFDVQRAYKEVKLFHDMASSASKAQGIISLDYKLAGKLDGNMFPVYPSLKGGGTLSVSKVKVKGLRLFSEVSKETNKNVTDPDLSKVDIKSTINNNIITIERTRMKVSAFKLRIEGQTSFDGRLNLHFRVGLPPFGIIGIPVSVTGTQDKPIIKARRANKKDELEEDKDDEEGKTN